MTCVVGVVHDGHVYIGADSAGVGDSYDLSVRSDRKVFRNGPFVMGFTSSFRMGQLLAYALTVPDRHPDKDVMAFMVTTFVDAVRSTLKAGGFATLEKAAEAGGTFLVGYAGRLFQIFDDYQVAEAACGFDACGCGGMIALGSLHRSQGAEPAERVMAALAAAEALSAGVRGPFHVMRTFLRMEGER